MRDFFSLDGPFNKYGGMLADMVILSLMWLLFSLPIITSGAATAALFYVSTRRIANREGYITTDFWEAFKTNFVRATVIWVILLLIFTVLLFNVLIIIFGEAGTDGIFSVVLPAQFVFVILLSFMCVYIFPMIARFDMPVKLIIRSSFYMSVRHLLTSITTVVLLLGGIILFIQMPPLLIVIPGVYAWLASILIMKVFKKYRPEMDRDPALELAEIEARLAEERRRRDLGLDPLEPEGEETVSDEDEETNRADDFWADIETNEQEDKTNES